MPYAPTLSTSTDANPCPRSLVTFSSLAAGTQTVNVAKIVEGREFEVRGGINLFAVGGAAVLDVEPAFGASMSYRAEMFDAAGASLGFTDSTAEFINPLDAMSGLKRAWITQPLNPSLAVQVTLLADTAATKVRKSPGGVVYAEGSTVGTRIGGQRQGLSGLTVTVLCDSPEDADEFQSMFGGYTSDFPSVVCIRSAPPLRIPRILFAATDGPTEIGYQSDGVIAFTMTIDEVLPPSPGLVLPSLRRMDIDAAFPTRAARAAAYATRLERDTDYSKAGLAG